MTEATPTAPASWTEAVCQLRRDVEALGKRAHELARVPADIGIEEARRAWLALSYGAEANGPAAGGFALANLRASWERLGSSLAGIFEATLRTLSGRLQGGNGSFPSTDLAPKGVMLFNAADGCVPSGFPTAARDLYVAGYFEALDSSHPLRQAMPDRTLCYWLEDATWDNPRYCFLLGGVVTGENGNPAVPDFLNVDLCARMTQLAAEEKRRLRQRMLHQRQIEEEEAKKREEKLTRAIRWNAMSEDSKVEVIEQLQRRVAELESHRQTVAK